jgi:succinate dehydrogenase / fumarate reductase membrane anchor subunit
VSLRSPLARALHHGAAHDGVGHWWLQRVTATALAPLSLWLLISLLSLPDADYASVTAWIRAGWNPVLLALTVLTACWHSWLGVQVVIEDYVRHAGVKTFGLLLSMFAHAVLAASAVYAVLCIALSSAA